MMEESIASPSSSASVSSPSPMALPKPTVGVLSIGEMGSGIAKLLRSHDISVATVATGRSASTKSRITAAGITMLADDGELISQTDIILSIVPPRHAIATARRISDACASPAGIKARNARRATTNAPPRLTYVDMNSVSPTTINAIARVLCPQPPTSPRPVPRVVRRRTSFLARFASSSPPLQDPPPDPVPIDFIDGAIIGPLPSLQPDTKVWTLPSLVFSGPTSLPFSSSSSSASASGSTASAPGPHRDLARILNVTHISPHLGAASTLKSCYSTLTRGLTALSILSLSTAQSASVLPQLTSHLEKFSPMTLSLVSESIPAVPRDAHRHIEEMRQIGETLTDVGGFRPAKGRAVLEGLAEVYKFVDEETELGRSRKRGKSAEEVIGSVEQAVRKRRQTHHGAGSGTGGNGGGGSGSKEDDEDEMSMTWRGSWT